MEQYKNCSSPRSAYAPASPCRRHIHSSFPHYFYSTPAAPPSSDSISAFVALCESRLVPEDDRDFASGSENHRVPAAAAPPPPVSSSTPVALQGKLLPVAPPKEAAARPLKPPPRLQYIANIRRSLRNSIPAGLRRSSLRGGGGSRAPKPSKSGVARRKDGADPFAAAAHKVAREEDSPWCQLPWRRNRKSKVAHEAAAAAATRSEDGMNDQADQAATSKNRRKGSWILRMLRTAIKGKEKEKEKEKSSDSKEEEEEEEEEGHAKNEQLVGLVRCTTVSRRRRVLVRRRTSGSSRRRQY